MLWLTLRNAHIVSGLLSSQENTLSCLIDHRHVSQKKREEDRKLATQSESLTHPYTHISFIIVSPDFQTTMPQYFAIIGHNDNPIYEAEFNAIPVNPKTPPTQFPSELRELTPFIAHAALDIIEDMQWQMLPSNSPYGSDNPGSSSSFSLTGSGFLRSKSNANVDNCYLGRVDHFYGLAVTAYITYSGVKFVMVHGNPNTMNISVSGMVGGSTGTATGAVGSSSSVSSTAGDSASGHNAVTNVTISVDDSACKTFYQEVHELYIKTIMNPFYSPDDKITSPAFDLKVRALARKYLSR